MGVGGSTCYNTFPLHEAVKNSYIGEIQALLKKGSLVNCKDASPNGFTPLQYAVKHDNFEIAKILIEHSALVEKTGGDYAQTSLHYAIECDSSITLVELLIKNGSATNVKDSLGNTPLHYAAYHGRISVIRELLQHGAAIKEMNNACKTPLDLAREQNCIQCVQLLSGAELGN